MKVKVSPDDFFQNRYVAFGALVLALLTISACGRNKVQAAPAMPPPLVTVVKATAQDVPRYLDEIGKMPRSNR